MIQGVCQAGAIVTGQTLGEGDREKAQEQAYGFLGFGLLLGLISAGFILAVSGFVIRSYKVSPETANMARQLMNAISLILVLVLRLLAAHFEWNLPRVRLHNADEKE